MHTHAGSVSKRSEIRLPYDAATGRRIYLAGHVHPRSSKRCPECGVYDARVGMSLWILPCCHPVAWEMKRRGPLYRYVHAWECDGGDTATANQQGRLLVLP